MTARVRPYYTRFTSFVILSELALSFWARAKNLVTQHARFFAALQNDKQECAIPIECSSTLAALLSNYVGINGTSHRPSIMGLDVILRILPSSLYSTVDGTSIFAWWIHTRYKRYKWYNCCSCSDCSWQEEHVIKNFVLLALSVWCTISLGVITRTTTKGLNAKGAFSQTFADSNNGSQYIAITELVTRVITGTISPGVIFCSWIRSCRWLHY